MQNKLTPNQIERVGKKFHDHPLFVACDSAFGHYEAELQRLLFASEEIFLEAAIILDDILAEPEGADQRAAGLWNSLKRKIRYWDREAPQEDLDKITGAILCVVAATLIQHYHSFFCFDVVDEILTQVQENMNVPKEERKRYILELSRCAEGLDKWLFEYAESDVFLSDEILETAKGAAFDKADFPSYASSQTFKAPKSRETMTFKVRSGVSEAHLRLLYMKLTQEPDMWIVGNEPDFMALFSGKRDEECVLTWSGKYGKGTLVGLFKRLVEASVVIIPEGYTLTRILEGHFKDRNGEWLTNLSKGNNTHEKAMPVINECISLLRTNFNRLLDGSDEEDFKSVYDPYDHQDMHIHKH